MTTSKILKWRDVDHAQQINVTNAIILLAAQKIKIANNRAEWDDAEAGNEARAFAQALEAARDFLVENGK